MRAISSVTKLLEVVMSSLADQLLLGVEIGVEREGKARVAILCVCCVCVCCVCVCVVCVCVC